MASASEGEEQQEGAEPSPSEAIDSFPGEADGRQPPSEDPHLFDCRLLHKPLSMEVITDTCESSVAILAQAILAHVTQGFSQVQPQAVIANTVMTVEFAFAMGFQ